MNVIKLIHKKVDLYLCYSLAMMNSKTLCEQAIIELWKR